MGPRYIYEDMLDNVISPIACVSMNHQNQLEQMANGAMFDTNDHPLVVKISIDVVSSTQHPWKHEVSLPPSATTPKKDPMSHSEDNLHRSNISSVVKNHVVST
jgi:hypothetical protein